MGGDGHGGPAAPLDTPATGGPATVAAADVNGDGVMDVAVPGLVGTAVLLGNGDGAFHGGALYGGAFQAQRRSPI